MASESLLDFDRPNVSLTCIDIWLTKIAHRISSVKRLFKNEYERLGQVCLFLNMNYTFSSQPGPLIHRHFARLTDSESVCLLDNMRVKGCGLGTWTPKSCFPSPDEDLLLFLCLMGTMSFFPFCEHLIEIPNFHSAKQARELNS